MISGIKTPIYCQVYSYYYHQIEEQNAFNDVNINQYLISLDTLNIIETGACDSRFEICVCSLAP